jgi:N-acetylglucosamine-6-phosphate deacetylase
MSAISLQNARAVRYGQVDEGSSIAIDDGRIIEADTEFPQIIDCSGLTLFPAFIDVHIHGAVGVDVNGADVDGLYAIGKFLAQNGVTR